ncbi:MAG TPA: ABC transporter substrate-binding protein/permease [Candidatus Hydrogenedentes bacterium]|nr:ABC transporter substrate-binding protein/permease [Candidatus Hydrogenedentota bacterium]
MRHPWHVLSRAIMLIALVTTWSFATLALAEVSDPGKDSTDPAAKTTEATPTDNEMAVAADAGTTGEESSDGETEEEETEYTDADFTDVQTVQASSDILRYGVDLEGGLPYFLDSWDGSGKLIGFEQEIIEEICRRLNRKPVPVQINWDKLIPGLERGLYDMACEGQEITPEHEAVVQFTVPYYVTGLQLCTHERHAEINSLADVEGKRVGVLKASLSYDLLAEMGNVDIATYDTEVNGFDDLINGRLDAVLFDQPVALYYGKPRESEGIRFIDEEIGAVKYGFVIDARQTDLLEKVNTILLDMRASGQLRAILERWGLWNAQTAREFGDPDVTPRAEPVMLNAWVEHSRPIAGLRARFDRYVSFLPMMGRGALLTMEVSILAMLLAVALGFVLATIRVYAPWPLAMLSVLYIEIIRGTPVLIQLYFIFYGLPAIGIKLSPFIAGVVGLGLNYAAYEAENYRAGFAGVPHTQMEAALSLGMTRWQAIRHVIAPQAFRIVLPPVTNDFISLLKDSSLVSVITLVELTKTYGLLATKYYDYFGTGIMVAVIYLLLGLPFVRLARYTERKLAAHLPSTPNLRR